MRVHGVWVPVWLVSYRVLHPAHRRAHRKDFPAVDCPEGWPSASSAYYRYRCCYYLCDCLGDFVSVSPLRRTSRPSKSAGQGATCDCRRQTITSGITERGNSNLTRGDGGTRDLKSPRLRRGRRERMTGRVRISVLARREVLQEARSGCRLRRRREPLEGSLRFVKGTARSVTRKWFCFSSLSRGRVRQGKMAINARQEEREARAGDSSSLGFPREGATFDRRRTRTGTSGQERWVRLGCSPTCCSCCA